MLEMWESVVETRQKRWIFKFFMMVLSISVGRLSQGTKRRSFIVLTYFDIAHSKQVFQWFFSFFSHFKLEFLSVKIFKSHETYNFPTCVLNSYGA